MSKSNRKIIIVYILTMIFAIAFIIIVSMTKANDSKIISEGSVINYNKNWSYVTNNITKNVSLPCNIDVQKNEPLIITNTLPYYSTEEYTLCVRTFHQSLETYIDGIKIYDYQKSRGSLYHLIRIPEGAKGKSITLKLISPYKDYSGKVNSMTIGNKSDNIMHILMENASAIVVGIIIFILGILLILIFIVSLNMKMNVRSLFFLGNFALITAVWTITDTNIAQLLTGRVTLWYVIAFFSFLLLPIPMMLFIRESNVMHKKRGYDIWTIVFICNFFIDVILQIFHILDFMETLKVTHLLIGLAIIYILITCFIEIIKYKNRKVIFLTTGLGILLGFVMIDILRFYVAPYKDDTYFFRIGLLIFIIMFSVRTVNKAIAILKLSITAKTYEKLAYTDTMTRLLNRTAFDEKMKELAGKIAKIDKIGFIVFDLNYLKTTNDTCGHIKGDELIKGFASCLYNVFRNSGKTYRIGGDEFVVIIENMSEKKINALISSLYDDIKEYNKSEKIKIEAAYGCSVMDIDGLEEIDLENLLNVADKKMYENKRKTKNRSV